MSFISEFELSLFFGQFSEWIMDRGYLVCATPPTV